jgi:sugar phosphate isomerase/epimerase
MAGIEGLGQRALAGRQGPDVAARAAAFDDLGMRVTPANVLGIYNVIMEEAQRLRLSVRKFQHDHFDGMPLLGGDLVSPYAKRGFDDATNQLLARCRSQIDEMARVGEELAKAARTYQKSEAEIAAAFDPRKVEYKPSPIPPALQAPQSPQPLQGTGPVQPATPESLNKMVPRGMR